MKRYNITLTDGHCYAGVHVHANDVEEACEKAFELAERKNIVCDTPFDSDGKPDYIDGIEIIDGDGQSVFAEVPLQYVRVPYEIDLIADPVVSAKQMVKQGRAEEAIKALEEIPGLKGLWNLVMEARS